MPDIKKIAFSAVIFDLDGTLIDSEDNYVAADTNMLKDYGIEYTHDLHCRLLGKGIDIFPRILIDEYGVKETPEAILSKKDRYYMDIARTNTVVFPEMKKLLDIFKSAGIPMALASGSSQPAVDELLKICGVWDYFAVAISSVGRLPGKPNPAVFLETAGRLGIPPAECLVLEDSPSGVAAALAAGMKVVAIPTFTNPPLDPIYEKATVLFPGGMGAFSAEDLLGNPLLKHG